jgi:hypothetical protein
MAVSSEAEVVYGRRLLRRAIKIRPKHRDHLSYSSMCDLIQKMISSDVFEKIDDVKVQERLMELGQKHYRIDSEHGAPSQSLMRRDLKWLCKILKEHYC